MTFRDKPQAFIDDKDEGLSILLAGVQSGKTMALLTKMVQVCTAEKPVEVGLGTMAMSLFPHNLWPKLLSLLPDMGGDVKTPAWSSGWAELEMPNGSMIYFFSYQSSPRINLGLEHWFWDLPPSYDIYTNEVDRRIVSGYPSMSLAMTPIIGNKATVQQRGEMWIYDKLAGIVNDGVPLRVYHDKGEQ